MTHKRSKTQIPRFNSTSIWIDLTSIHQICLKYRYSTRGQVQYWATIRPTIRPWIMPEYRKFSNSKAGSSYSPKFDLKVHYQEFDINVSAHFSTRTFRGCHNISENNKRLDSDIESKSSSNTYLNIIQILFLL